METLVGRLEVTFCAVFTSHHCRQLADKSDEKTQADRCRDDDRLFDTCRHRKKPKLRERKYSGRTGETNVDESHSTQVDI